MKIKHADLSIGMREHDSHPQSVTVEAMERSDNLYNISYCGLYGFLTNLKNKATIILYSDNDLALRFRFMHIDM